MNHDSYVECLVARKTSSVMKFLSYLLILLTVAFGFIGIAGVWIALIIAIATGVLAYVVYSKIDVEYEYLYLDRELAVDRITNKSRRKKVGTYEVDKFEILAPATSYHLDEYKNRQCKVMDYSSGEEGLYVIYLEGNTKILFNPNEEMVKAIYNIAPRKVFKD